MEKTTAGPCFCGAVEPEVTGDPAGMGYCHCESGRHWSAGPVNALTLWQPEKVRVVKGAEHLKQCNKTENSDRKWCDLCSGHVLSNHPGLMMVDVYAAIIPGVRFAPGLHVNCAEAVLAMKDGLPELRDFPSEFGGTGIALPE